MMEPGDAETRAHSMPPDPAGNDIPEDPRIVEVVQEYLSELEQGRSPDREAYCRRYPELAGAIGQCLDGLEMLHAGASRSTGGRRRQPPVEAGVDAPPTALGDFRIVREVARGGMGIVYEAIQLSLGRRVALKVLPFAATLDERQLQRFKNEAQAAALLHHTHIVPVFAVGCERGVHFYAMQLIEGESLATLIEQLRRRAGWGREQSPPTSSRIHSSYVLGGQPATTAFGPGNPAGPEAPREPTLSPFHADLSTQHAGRDTRFFRTTARLMLQAAQALAHAHEFGIVHRDIKPGNLLLDVLGQLWITDFGLAQFHADAGLTRTGDIPGTIRYMSPEQASGQAAILDGRTDLYSLGATFYELLTLDPVFDGRNMQTLLQQILHVEPTPLRQRDRTIPPELETIVLKCLSKNAADRYVSAGALAADIERYLEHKPILARPPTLVDRARKWSRRHPSVIASGMLLLLVASVGLFISNRLITAEQKETKAQEEKTREALGREEERANEAEEAFRHARRAVDMLVQVSEEELADNPMVQPARERLLEIALGYYRDLLDQKRNDPTLAAVQEQVKDILRSLALVQQDMNVGRLHDPAVQRDLGIDDLQRKKLEPWLQAWGRERNATFEDRTLDEDARRRQFVEMAKRHDLALGEILTPPQRHRLEQLAIQAQGIMAFKDPKVVQALKLTSAQRSTIREIEHDVFGRGGPFFGGRGRGRGGPGRGGWDDHDGPRDGRGGGPGFRGDRDDRDGRRGPPEGPRLNRTESVAKVLAILTEEQRQAWRELAGAPSAAIEELQPFPGFGPGPPGFERGGRPPRPDDFRP